MSYNLRKRNALKKEQRLKSSAGELIKFYVYTEATITRDNYKFITGKTPEATITAPAHPITFSPDTRILSRAGIEDQVDVIIRIAEQEFIDVGRTGDSIDKFRWIMEIRGLMYRIENVVPRKKFLEVYLDYEITGYRI